MRIKMSNPIWKIQEQGRLEMMTRDEALAMLGAHGFTDSLLKHSLASEAVLEALAVRLGADPALWGLTGLLHDLDYPETEANPARHGLNSAQELADALPEEALQAIRSHNGECNGCQPSSQFDYALRCGETVTGLISAAALMRPTGYEGMSVKSIKKKMKDKAFAASVNRENIKECAKAGIELDDFLLLAISAMAQQADNAHS